jgi:hypothetical protein
LRQLLLQLAQAIFGSLARRPAHDHASDMILLLCDLSLQLFLTAVEILRHTSTTVEVRVGSLSAKEHRQGVAVRPIRIPSQLQSNPTDPG